MLEIDLSCRFITAVLLPAERLSISSLNVSMDLPF